MIISQKIVNIHYVQRYDEAKCMFYFSEANLFQLVYNLSVY